MQKIKKILKETESTKTFVPDLRWGKNFERRKPKKKKRLIEEVVKNLDEVFPKFSLYIYIFIILSCY